MPTTMSAVNTVYKKFRSKEETKLSIIDYLAFYNEKRIHSKLDYQSSLEFVRTLYRKTD